MSRKIIFITAFVIAGLVLTYFGLRSFKGSGAVPEASAASIWVEVTSEKVSVSGANGVHALGTGDEISAGDTITSDANGGATIHMPDGSVFRLDPDSKLTLDRADFAAADQTIVVKATLASGRVWSKVVSLATPQSEWTVKTSNAVATVRGTSFGVEYRDKKSRVLVSEHKVIVTAINQELKTIAAGSGRDVSEGNFIEIKDSEGAAPSAQSLALPSPMPLEKMSDDAKNWGRKNTEADRTVDEKLNAIRKEKLDDREMRVIMREETKDLREKVRGLKGKSVPETEINKVVEKSDPQEFTGRIRAHIERLHRTPTREAQKDEIKVISNIQPQGLEIVFGTTTPTVTEGNRVRLKAYLVYPDGKKEITDKVVWTITGEIGSVANGVFTAKIPDKYSELPEIKGGLQATYKDDHGSLESNTIDITVEPAEVYTVPIG